MMATDNLSNTNRPTRIRPFRKAVLRGLAVLLPPLLTLALFLWAWSLVHYYVLSPVESAVRYIVVELKWDVETVPHDKPLRIGREGRKEFDRNEKVYVVLPRTDEGIPFTVYDEVAMKLDLKKASARDCYYAFVDDIYLKPVYVVPVFLCVFLMVLYLLGKFLAAGVGHFVWAIMDRTITRLPVIRNVYSSVKQVTDFIFTDRKVEYTQVVAVEYPRKGAWSIGFVTGEGMKAIKERSQEPMISVLMPTSPMPVTGFIITVPRSETIDLDITIDQAIQFVVSCGVVVPVEQQSATEIDGLPVIPKMIKQSLQTGDDGEEDTDRSGEELSEDDPDPSADP
jgi:uncharacterized membrane protein